MTCDRPGATGSFRGTGNRLEAHRKPVKPQLLYPAEITHDLTCAPPGVPSSAMALTAPELRIVFYPDPALRAVAEPIATIDERVRSVAGRMIELMHEARGVGLAAPQVGLGWRLFVANPTGEPGDDTVFINPVLSNPSRETEPHEEGCLSIPEVRAQITRPRRITITATGLDGRAFEMTSDELPARVWQHENDHLDGVLILDKMTRFDKMANRKLVKELEQRPAE